MAVTAPPFYEYLFPFLLEVPASNAVEFEILFRLLGFSIFRGSSLPVFCSNRHVLILSPTPLSSTASLPFADKIIITCKNTYFNNEYAKIRIFQQLFSQYI